MTIKEIFVEMQKRMDANPGKLGGIKAVFQFEITGADSGNYSVAVGDGSAKVSEGAADSPNVTVTMASNDFADMVEGRLDSMAAFMGGKLKVKGDMMLAMQLQSLLK
ncbi:MAG: SCP2 sterol-binding domain-containing protein [Deltaproteobacteria bacterium]|nr:SCP2 sterol-binding domain-containing protein [Deltaproteobacteria bacterium]